MKIKANLLNEWRDESTSPGEDFYQYANGGWLKNNPVPDDQSIWASFTEVHQKNEEVLRKLLEHPNANSLNTDYGAAAVNYFQSVMDTTLIKQQGLKPLENIFNIIDGTTRETLPATTALLHRHGISAFFHIDTEPDFDHPRKYMAYFEQGGLGLPEKSYYQSTDKKSRKLHDDYQQHIAQQFVNLGYNDSQTMATAKQIFDFERLLADVSYSKVQLRDMQLVLKRYKLSKLDEALGIFSVAKYANQVGLTLEASDEVSVNNLGFFKRLGELLADTDVELLKNYLRWRVLYHYAKTLTHPFEDEYFAFYEQRLRGVSEKKPRWKQALDALTSDVGEAIGRLYVEAEFRPEDKSRIENMVDNLLQEMQRTIKRLDWMSNDTKQEALDKLSKFSYKIGYPDEWRDFSSLMISSTATYCENKLKATRFKNDRKLGRVGMPVNSSEWSNPPHIVNAFYNPLLNEIVFPAGILQPPFYFPEGDDPIMYGAIGAVIGHEITHGFDDQGSQFDGDGRLRVWWTDRDKKEFERRADQLDNQYSAYSPLPGKQLNGKLTLGENIADLGGASIAYRALKHANPALTKEQKQRFFLAFATIWRNNIKPEYAELLLNIDPHSPGKFRTNGVIANFPEFGAVFDLPANSTLVNDAKKRIRIW